MDKLGSGWVHNELPIDKMFFDNYDIRDEGKKKYIDIAIIINSLLDITSRVAHISSSGTPPS